jgi:hypothetical protein
MEKITLIPMQDIQGTWKISIRKSSLFLRLKNRDKIGNEQRLLDSQNSTDIQQTDKTA